MSSKGINIISLLIELATCCSNQEKSLILTQECLDYLRSVDNLDQYVGVPNTIDEAMYKIICKHRRFKIENELKIKANTIEQQDIDIAIQAFQKNLATKKDFGSKLIIRLQEQRDDLIEFIHDKHMQIVIKSGLVEINRNGNINDCENAILINRQDVETINKFILKAGARKLQVMNEKMVHRRSILMKEWEHKKMKMEIEDLNEHLRLIDHVKVTKEIQQYLRQRAKGESFDKGTLTLDQEIESKKMSYEKIILERKTAIDELEKQIKEYKKKNKILDQQIAEINVDVCEQQESRDLEFEEKYKQNLKNRMTAIVKRSKLVKLIQEQHNEILVLQTELELLRLKTYPTLKFKTLF